MRARSALALGVTVLVVAAAVSGCGGDAQQQEVESDSRAKVNTDDQAVIELADGRLVDVSYGGGGLVERHQNSPGSAWSSPRTIYRTKTGPCQGIKLEAHRKTVAVIAEFADFCQDGEPPTESVAAVGSGDLSRWDVNLTRHSDGWPRARFLGEGKQVKFVEHLGAEGTRKKLWREGEGFDKKPDPFEPTIDRLVGTWKAKDGSHRVTFEPAEPEDRSLTVTIRTLRGAPCEARGEARMNGIHGDKAQIHAFMEVKGGPARHCPPRGDGPVTFEFEDDKEPLRQVVLDSGEDGIGVKTPATYVPD